MNRKNLINSKEFGTLPHIQPGRPAESGQLILERRWRILQKTVYPHLLAGRVIDLGCGNGAQTEVLVGHQVKVWGIDLFSPDQRDRPSFITEGKFPFIVGDAMEIPIKSSSVDLVTSFEVLEHVENDHTACQEVVRILKKGGGFFYTVPNRWWIFETHGAHIPHLSKIPWNRVPFLSYLPRSLHRRIAKARNYTLSEALQLSGLSGLIPQQWGYITAPMDILKEGWIKRLLRNTLFKEDITSIPIKAVNIFVFAIKS
ncbi:MAG: class I SAM-dependent methyltransferase [bacterium]